MKCLFFSILFLLACQPKPDPDSALPASGFVHAVYFYLNENLSEDQKKDFKNVLDTLAQIPSIEHVVYGPPAMTPRQVVDNDYDYAWITIFKDKAGHDAYQEHPIHVHFKEKYTPMIAEVKIYDNLYP